jgi:fructosamine-3-kinase
MSMTIGLRCMNCELSTYIYLTSPFSGLARTRLTRLVRYHHLNHHTIFGSGYRSSATSIMHKLLKKYAK